MSSTKRSVMAAGVALAIGLGPAAVLLGTAAGAAEDSGPPQVTNRETVSLKADATGVVDKARIYDQIAVTGKGSVTLDNPISCENLRNLNGWGAPECSDDQFSVTIDADGQTRYRTVSDLTQDLPFSITGSWKLDGESISPADLVGKSGEVEVTYRLENTSGKLTKLTFEDGTGAEVTKEEKVYTPLAGSLSIVLPSNYTNVAAPAGVVAGDGKNGSRLSFSATLIPPLGGPIVEVGYTADVKDATVPPASLSVAVVRPYDNPSVSSASESFAGGVETGQTLTAGATTIDENLLKLSTGAGTLLAGLLQLQAGAETLNAGLQDAAEGSAKLADGSGQVADGLNETAVPGAQKVAGGAAQVSTGLAQLNGQIPALTKGVADLLAGAKQVADGLNQLEAGLDAPLPNGFGAGLDALATGLATLPATVSALKSGVQSIAATDCGNLGCQQTVAGVVAQITAKEPDIALAAGTAAALNNAYKSTIRPTIAKLSGGADQVAAGLAALNAQLAPLAAGVGQLAAGSAQVTGGAQQLAAGLESKLAPGATTVAEGNEDLATGLGAAAEKTPQLAEGLGDASGGVPQIVDGTKQLSAEGTQKLIEAGNDTAMDFGLRFAIIEASAETTKDGGLPYGAPEQSELASAAYTMDLAGEGSTGGSDAVKGIVALVLLGGAAAGGAALAARR